MRASELSIVSVVAFPPLDHGHDTPESLFLPYDSTRTFDKGFSAFAACFADFGMILGGDALYYHGAVPGPNVPSSIDITADRPPMRAIIQPLIASFR